MYSIEEFDKAKTKVLKYILYKSRSENEVRTKFQNEIEENLLEDVIEYLKEAKYINDNEYIRNKLIAEGLEKDLIEDYFYENKEELTKYEINSASNIILKKQKDLDDFEIKNYLLKKGYKQDNINEAFETLKQ